MKWIFLVILFALLAPSAIAQEKDRDINIGERFSFRSKILNEDRPYWVYLPDTYHSKQLAAKAYPVLYLLDGDTHFHSASGVIKFMSAGLNGNFQIPELIIIALPNTNRARDFTPTHALRDAQSKAELTFPSSGGADNFVKFLREEFIPHIETSYRTLPYRIVVGHSLGGVFALHTLLSAPTTFQGIIAIDPSLWWDNQILVSRGKTVLSEAKGLSNSVFISMANHPRVLDDPEINKDAIKTFTRLLETNGSTRLRAKLQYFESEDHGSVPLQSLYHGLLFIFAGYKPAWTILLKQPSEVTAHFKNISERLGVELLPPERFVNLMGQVLMGQMRELDKAIELFKLNISNYPRSSNAYNSLAEAYLVKDEKQLAIKNYERALELNPENQNARDRLQKLQSH